jgi:regulator of protease activity HflC (stomatin/prohibitin superfamily)
MHHQMRAERTRRATVTEAAGEREAAIAKAEGEKQAAILQSEGQKASTVLEAEGKAEATRAVAEAERFRQETVAQGEAAAIRTVYQAIHDGGPSNDLLAVKYLETLQAMADGRATKIFLPTEASALLGALGGMSELLGSRVSGDGTGTADGAAERRPPERTSG